MTEPRVNATAVVSGLLFIVVGSLFLLDRLDVIVVRPSLVWPLLLIGLGVAVLLGGSRRRAVPPAPHPPDPTTEPLENRPDPAPAAPRDPEPAADPERSRLDDPSDPPAAR